MHKLDIPDELGAGWVEIHEKLSWSQAKSIEGKALRMRAKPGADIENMRDEDVIMEPDVLAGGIAKLDTYVTRWSLCDDAGKPLPVGRRGFTHADFDPDVGDWIIKASDEYYEDLRRSKSGPNLAEVAAPAGGEES